MARRVNDLPTGNAAPSTQLCLRTINGKVGSATQLLRLSFIP